MLKRLKKAILDDWENWDLGPAPRDVSIIRRRSAWLNHDGKEVFFIFRRGGTFPLLIAKSVSSKAFENAICNEAQSTISLHHRIQGKFKLNLPFPLCLTEINGFPVYIEKAIAGATLPEKVAGCWFERRKKNTIQRIVFELSNWLEDFYDAMEVKKSMVTSSILQKRFFRPLNQFRSLHTLTKEERLYLSQIADRAGSLEGNMICFPPIHGDLWGGSLLCGADGQLWIIDWEFFKPAGLPLQDILCFAMHPGFPVHNHSANGMLGEFMNLFHDSYFTHIIITSLHKHARAAGLNSPEFIEMLFALTLIKLSLERDNRTLTETGHSWRALFGFLVENRNHCRIIK